MNKLQYISVLNKEYFDNLKEYNQKEQQNAIKIALMMVKGFRDILDELNYNEEKLRNLQFSLDDNYEIVEKLYKSAKEQENKKLIDELLTQMAKLEMEIGDFILEHKHAS